RPTIRRERALSRHPPRTRAGALLRPAPRHPGPPRRRGDRAARLLVVLSNGVRRRGGPEHRHRERRALAPLRLVLRSARSASLRRRRPRSSLRPLGAARARESLARALAAAGDFAPAAVDLLVTALELAAAVPPGGAAHEAGGARCAAHPALRRVRAAQLAARSLGAVDLADVGVLALDLAARGGRAARSNVVHVL